MPDPLEQRSAPPKTAPNSASDGITPPTSTLGLQGLAWLLAAQAAGELTTRALALPLPGPVLGMALLLVLNVPTNFMYSRHLTR